MTEHHQHHHHDTTPTNKIHDDNNNNDEGGGSSLGNLFMKNADDESLPFLDKLLENPIEFLPSQVLPAVADNNKEDVVIQEEEEKAPPILKDMKKKNSFCNPMMGMGGHEMMAHHGVGAMTTVGGGMSGGMIMYMDGFRFAMTGNQPCLNLYFPSWTLDTRWKFIAALICVFSLSFATEAISKFRQNLSKRRINNNNNIVAAAGREQQQHLYQARRTRQMIISGLHGVQALLGYVVMLATMTFSVEILLSVVLGLSSGYYYYFAGEIGLEGHVTTNPCCNYMQDESDEHEQRQQQQQQAAVDTSYSVEEQPPCCNEDFAATTSLLTSDPTEV